MNLRSTFFFLSCLLLTAVLSSCGGGSGGGDTTEETPVTPELVKIFETFGQEGNLWKPKAEPKSSTAGLLVVLLGSKHTGRFDGCSVETIDGEITPLDCNDRVEWSHIPFSCLANGNREHWRGLFTCDQAAQARVVCRNATEELTVEAAGPGISAVCSRHG